MKFVHYVEQGDGCWHVCTTLQSNGEKGPGPVVKFTFLKEDAAIQKALELDEQEY